MRTTPIKLAPGEDLRLRLEQLAQAEQASGFVLGVVGNLSRAAFQCPGPPEPTVMEGDLEIITLNGTVSPTGVHLHLRRSEGACVEERANHRVAPRTRGGEQEGPLA